MRKTYGSCLLTPSQNLSLGREKSGIPSAPVKNTRLGGPQLPKCCRPQSAPVRPLLPACAGAVPAGGAVPPGGQSAVSVRFHAPQGSTISILRGLWRTMRTNIWTTVVVDQSLSRVRLFVMDCSTPGLPVHHSSQSLLKLMPVESVMPSNHLILYHPLLLLPSVFPTISLLSREHF